MNVHVPLMSTDIECALIRGNQCRWADTNVPASDKRRIAPIHAFPIASLTLSSAGRKPPIQGFGRVEVSDTFLTA